MTSYRTTKFFGNTEDKELLFAKPKLLAKKSGIYEQPDAL
jgi:hypothetical protein